MKINSAAPLVLATVSLAEQILLPPAPGPYNVSVRTSELHDFSRDEIYAQDAEHRRLMVSVFSPSPEASGNSPCRMPKPCVSPYMSKAVADFENNLAAQFNITADFNVFTQSICTSDVTHGPARNANASTDNASFPLVIFSTGHTAPRSLYNLMMQYFASFGYITVLVDHPYSAYIVEFPDGSTAFYNTETDKTVEHTGRHIEVRTADMSFVLDQLSGNSTFKDLVLAPNVDVQSFERVGVWGHSIGGASAIHAVQKDDRFGGAINIDGGLFDPSATGGVDRPVLTWQDGDSVTHPTWNEKWSLFRDYKQLLRLEGSLHDGMTDIKLLADLLNINAAPLFGSVDGMLQINTLVAYAVDFFKFVLEDEDRGLLSGPSADYPHVTFLDKPAE
jgi:dienelactone hydrolase